MRLPRYPIYVPSKGRAGRPLTIRFLLRDDVPFCVVVEEAERDAYAALVGHKRLLVLPQSGGGLLYARNWIMQHAIAEGHERHWQLDDNMVQTRRHFKGKRIPCASGAAFAVCEDFTDRYENVAISGLNYVMNMPAGRATPPFYVNHHVYSCSLINNEIPHRWRLRYNDDTDICLQVLAAGWCTILVNAFMIEKVATMTVRGGNTDDLYQGDGRLVMARSLERMWPGVVKTDRRFSRPQHVVKDAWRGFDTPLRLKPSVDLDALAAEPNEYGLKLEAKRNVKSPEIRRLLDESAERNRS